MRRANDGMWLLDDDGFVEGIALGSDATSEHSGGVPRLRSMLGVPATFENGLADRTAKSTPPAVVYHEYTTEDGQPAALLVFGDQRYDLPFDRLMSVVGHELRFFSSDYDPSRENFSTAWDESSVGIHVKTNVHVNRLQQLHRAILDKDIAFGGDLIDQDRFIKASGLMFVLPSKLDPGLAQAAYEKDQKKVRLREAAAKLTIADELRAAGKRYFALSPRWKDEQESEVVFWLNPADQQDYRYGQYTVEELRQWARNEGPIIIDKALVALNEKYEEKLSGIRRKIEKAGFERPSLSIKWKDAPGGEFVVNLSYYHAQKDKPRAEARLYSLDELVEMFDPPKPSPKNRKTKP